MTPEQIPELVPFAESETLELKATTNTRREATATICGMLNRRGGLVIFGVKPNGTVTGQNVSECTLEEVSDEISQIDPPVFPEIERTEISHGKNVIDSGKSRFVTAISISWRRISSCWKHDVACICR